VYSKSRVKNFSFFQTLKFWMFFNALSFFQIEKKTEENWLFFCRKSLTQKMQMNRILTLFTNLCSSDEGL